MLPARVGLGVEATRRLRPTLIDRQAQVYPSRILRLSILNDRYVRYVKPIQCGMALAQVRRIKDVRVASGMVTLLSAAARAGTSCTCRQLHPSDGSGRAWLEEPTPDVVVQVSRPHRFTIVYEAVEPGISAGGAVYLQISPHWGWSYPQIEDPAEPGYTMVSTLAKGIELIPRDRGAGLLEVGISGRALAAGERVRIVFGAGHPAVRFLLLLAIADDAAGLVIIAVFYPTGELALEWLLLSVAAAVAAYVLFNWLPGKLDGDNELKPVSTRVRKTLSVWPYAVAAALSWFGFAKAGIHPSLGLLPVIPAIPHADRAFGLFSEAETHLHDLLNEAEHMLRYPVEVVLFLFGLLNAGVEFSAIAAPTWLVLAGLVIGKPFGVLLFGWVAVVILRLGLPDGMRIVDLFIIGCVAAIGFTVALFIAAVAFPPGEVQDAAKMGALLSFFAAVLAIAAGRFFRVEKQNF